MPFLELPGINEVKEKHPVPEGMYDLIVTDNPKIRDGKEKHKKNLLVVMAIDGHPEAANVMFNIALPNEMDEPESLNFKLLQIKRFCHYFGIDLDGGQLNTETFAGARATGMRLTVEEYPEGSGQKKNNLNLPPLPSED